MRRDLFEPGLGHDRAELSADVVRGERAAFAVAEEQGVGVDGEPFPQSFSDGSHGKRREDDGAYRA